MKESGINELSLNLILLVHHLIIGMEEARGWRAGFAKTKADRIDIWKPGDMDRHRNKEPSEWPNAGTLEPVNVTFQSESPTGLFISSLPGPHIWPDDFSLITAGGKSSEGAMTLSLPDHPLRFLPASQCLAHDDLYSQHWRRHFHPTYILRPSSGIVSFVKSFPATLHPKWGAFPPGLSAQNRLHTGQKLVPIFHLSIICQ